MAISDLKELLLSRGACFDKDRRGHTIVESVGDFEQEYKALREGFAVAMLPHVTMLMIRGDDAIDVLDRLVCADIGLLREERILHSIICDSQGQVLTEVYLACSNDEYLLVAEGGDDSAWRAVLDEVMHDRAVEVKDISSTSTCISVDGPYAWTAMSRVVGSDIFGVPYLSLLRPESDRWILRAGKTGEYAYWIVVPNAKAVELATALLDNAAPHPHSFIGLRTTQLAKLENRTLNLDAEGSLTRDPYELGLFWMVAVSSAKVGGDAIEQASTNIKRRLVGFRTDATQALSVGDPVYLDGELVGKVANVGLSPRVGCTIGLALLDRAAAYVGLNMEAGQAHLQIRTVSTPFLINESLRVRME